MRGVAHIAVLDVFDREGIPVSAIAGTSAGSIVGAIVGKQGIPEHWYRNFGDTVHSYLIGQPTFSIRDLIERFTTQAARVFGS